MLKINKTDAGSTLTVRVTPRSSREALAGVRGEALAVKLTAPPVEGAANKALIRFMAKALGVPKGRVGLVSGQKSREKRLLIKGLGPDEVRERLGL